jgi:hypothetical protein
MYREGYDMDNGRYVLKQYIHQKWGKSGYRFYPGKGKFIHNPKHRI